MAKVKIVLNTKEVFNIMKSKEMQDICIANAEEIQARLGDEYGTDIFVGKTRANASVGPMTKKALNDVKKNNTLLKAMR